MVDNDDMLRLGRRGQLSASVAFLMLKGAGYAAMLLLACWFFVAFFALVGRQLPDDSRDTPDPINRSDVVIEAGPTDLA